MAFLVPKGKTGFARLMTASVCSYKGLVAAFRHEDAFRMDVLLALILVPVALFSHQPGPVKALLVASVLLVVLVELVNSAIEATVDRISLDRHPLAGRAKDMGSAAVFLSLVVLACVWGLVFLG